MSDPRKYEQARVINLTHRQLHQRNLRYLIAKMEFDNAPALTPGQCNMMMTVFNEGKVTLKQLSELLQVKAPAVSVMVERMVEMGLLVREANPADRREVHISVSPQEAKRASLFESHLLDSTLQILEALGEKDALAWQQICERIRGILSTQKTQPVCTTGNKNQGSGVSK